MDRTTRSTDYAFDRRTVRQAKFTPSELAEMTGLSAEMQRVWRRRKQLPEGEGNPTRFSAFEAAEVIVRYELSRYGVSPGASAELGKQAAPLVLWFALINADGACEVIGHDPDVSNFLREFEHQRHLAMALAGVATLYRYVWRADGDNVGLVSDLQDVGAPGEVLSGFFIDLSHAGTRLAEVAGRPLMTVELAFPEGRPAKRVRRLTGQRSQQH